MRRDVRGIGLAAAPRRPGSGRRTALPASPAASRQLRQQGGVRRIAGHGLGQVDQPGRARRHSRQPRPSPPGWAACRCRRAAGSGRTCEASGGRVARAVSFLQARADGEFTLVQVQTSAESKTWTTTSSRGCASAIAQTGGGDIYDPRVPRRRGQRVQGRPAQMAVRRSRHLCSARPSGRMRRRRISPGWTWRSVGVPMDLGVTNRAGCRFGPRAVRGVERIGPYRARAAPRAARHAARGRYRRHPDAQPLQPGGVPRGHRGLFARIVAAGVMPLAVGGDHSITYSILRAVGASTPGRHGPHRRALRHVRPVRGLQVPPWRTVPERRAGRRARTPTA